MNISAVGPASASSYAHAARPTQPVAKAAAPVSAPVDSDGDHDGSKAGSRLDVKA